MKLLLCTNRSKLIQNEIRDGSRFESDSVLFTTAADYQFTDFFTKAPAPTAKETQRIDFEFSIGCDDDLKLIRNTLEGIMKTDERILNDPAPEIEVLKLREGSVDFFVRPWVKASDYWPVMCDLLEKVKLTFDEEGISIPFPQ